MRQHILHNLRLQFRRYVLSPPDALQLRQLCIEVSRHQQSGTMWPLLESGEDTIYCQGVIGGDVTSQDVPPLVPRRQLKADNIGPEMLDSLYRKIWCWPVEYCHSAAVSAWRVCSKNAVPIQPAGVDSISYLSLLKDAQVHLSLGHPPQSRLQPPVSSVTNLISTIPNPHPTPRRTPVTLTHPPPTDAFLSPDPAALPAHACLPFSPFLFSFRPRRPSLLVPVSVTVPVLPSSPTPCRSPQHGVLRRARTPGQVVLCIGYCGC